MPDTSAGYERTISIESGYTDSECHEGVDRREVEQKILIRRRAVILFIVTVFTVTTIMLVISVVHEEMNKHNVGYQELVCQETDLECFKLMCPQGWEWVRERGQCQLMEGECFKLMCPTSI